MSLPANFLTAIKRSPGRCFPVLQLRHTRGDVPLYDHISSDFAFVGSETVRDVAQAMYGKSQTRFFSPIRAQIGGSCTFGVKGNNKLLGASFDGTSERVQLQYGTVSGSGTASDWICALSFRVDSLAASATIVDIYNDTNSQSAIEIGHDTSGNISISIDSAARQYTSGTTLEAGKWARLIVHLVYDGSTNVEAEVYLNGEHLTSGGALNFASGFATTSVGEMLAGITCFGGTYAGARYYTGRIDRCLFLTAAWVEGGSFTALNPSSAEISRLDDMLRGPICARGGTGIIRDSNDNALPYSPSIQRVAPTERSLDPVTRHTTRQRMDVVLADDGWARNILTNYRAQTISAAVLLGNYDGATDPDDYMILFSGHVIDVRNDDTSITVELGSVENDFREKTADGNFIGHPLQVINRLADDAGIDPFLLDIDRMDPTDFEDISHFNVGKWGPATETDPIGHMSNSAGITHIGRLTDSEVFPHMRSLAALCDGSLVTDEFERLFFQYYDPTRAVDHKLAASDIAGCEMTALISPLFNRFVFKALGGQVNVELDYEAAQRRGPGGARRVYPLDPQEVIEGYENWIGAWAVEAESTGVGESIASLPANLSSITYAYLGMCGFNLDMGQRVSGGTQDPLYKLGGGISARYGWSFNKPSEYTGGYTTYDEKVALNSTAYADLGGANQTAFSCVLVFTIDDITNPESHFLLTIASDFTEREFQIRVTSAGQLAARVKGSVKINTPNGTIVEGTRYFLAVTYDGTLGDSTLRAKMWLAEIGTDSVVSDPLSVRNATGSDLDFDDVGQVYEFGRDVFTDSGYACMTLELYGAWLSTLSESQVNTLYNGGTYIDPDDASAPAGVLHWFSFGGHASDDPASQLTDMLGGGANGTPSNMESDDQNQISAGSGGRVAYLLVGGEGVQEFGASSDWGAGEIIKANANGDPDWSYYINNGLRPYFDDVYPAPAQYLPMWFPMGCTSAEYTISERQLFNTRALTSNYIRSGYRLFDITIPVFIAKRRLGRFGNGAPMFELKTQFDRLDIKVGDFVQFPRASVLMYGFDGIDTSTSDPVFEVVSKRVEFWHDSPGIVFKLCWVRNGDTDPTLTDSDLSAIKTKAKSAREWGGKALPLRPIDYNTQFSASASGLSVTVSVGVVTTLEGPAYELPIDMTFVIADDSDTYVYVDPILRMFTAINVATGAGTPGLSTTLNPYAMPLLLCEAASGSVTITNIAPDAWLPADVVDTDSIQDGAITTVKLANGSSFADVATTDATPTQVLAVDIANDSVYLFSASVVVKEDGADVGDGYHLSCVARRHSGTVTISGQSITFDAGGSTATAVFAVSGNAIILQVVGIAATNMTWAGEWRYIKQLAA